MSEPSLDAASVAAFLNIPTSSVFKLVRAGRLRAFRAGRHLRIRPAWLDEYIEANEVQPRLAGTH